MSRGDGGFGLDSCVLTCCGGHTSHSGDPRNPGTLHRWCTAHNSPLVPWSPGGWRGEGEVGGGMGGRKENKERFSIPEQQEDVM